MSEWRILNKKSFNLIKELSIAEFKLRDQGTILGFIWTLLHPLLVFVVLYLLFAKWTGKFVPDFRGYLLIGIVQWNFFAGTTTYALDVLIRRRDLVSSLNFPKEILVISTVFTGFLSHILEFLVLIGFLLFLGKAISIRALFLPLIIFLELVLILAVSLFISALFVYFRDIRRIWQIVIMLGFFATPIFYSLAMISEKARMLLALNPLTHIINSTRNILLAGDNPNILPLSLTAVFSLVLLFFAYCIFVKLSKWFSEMI